MLRLGHVSALDGLRGVAIAFVLGYHLGWLPSGLIGVDVFFGLSGFLITTLLLEERASTRGVDLRAFYMRRARRLLPAVVAVVVVVSLVYVGLHRDWAELPYAGAVLFYVGNLVRVAGDVFPRGFGQMWSLGQEEQFYLLWPLLLIFLLRRWRPRAIGRGLLAAAVLVGLWRLACWPLFGWGSHTLLSPDTARAGAATRLGPCRRVEGFSGAGVAPALGGVRDVQSRPAAAHGRRGNPGQEDVCEYQHQT